MSSETKSPRSGPAEETKPPVGAKRIFLGWEMLRIPYNLALTVTVLAVGSSDLSKVFGTALRLAQLATCCVLANALFLAGPAVETYAAWLGLRRVAVRVVLFAAGTAFAMALAAVVVSVWITGYLFPP